MPRRHGGECALATTPSVIAGWASLAGMLLPGLGLLACAQQVDPGIAIDDPRMSQPVVYGDDDRRDAYDYHDQAWATATLTWMSVSGVTDIEVIPHDTRKGGTSSGWSDGACPQIPISRP